MDYLFDSIEVNKNDYYKRKSKKYINLLDQYFYYLLDQLLRFFIKEKIC